MNTNLGQWDIDSLRRIEAIVVAAIAYRKAVHCYGQDVDSLADKLDKAIEAFQKAPAPKVARDE